MCAGRLLLLLLLLLLLGVAMDNRLVDGVPTAARRGRDRSTSQGAITASIDAQEVTVITTCRDKMCFFTQDCGNYHTLPELRVT